MVALSENKPKSRSNDHIQNIRITEMVILEGRHTSEPKLFYQLTSRENFILNLLSYLTNKTQNNSH